MLLFNNCDLNELSSESLDYVLNEHQLELSTMTQSLKSSCFLLAFILFSYFLDCIENSCATHVAHSPRMKFVTLGPLLKENSVFPCWQQDCHGLPRLTRAPDLCLNVTGFGIKYTSILNWNNIKSLHLRQSKKFHNYQ